MHPKHGGQQDSTNDVLRNQGLDGSVQAEQEEREEG